MLIFAFSQLSAAQRSKHFPGLLKLLWRFCLSVASERRAETHPFWNSVTSGNWWPELRWFQKIIRVWVKFSDQQTHNSGLLPTPEMPQGGYFWQFGKDVFNHQQSPPARQAAGWSKPAQFFGQATHRLTLSWLVRFNHLPQMHLILQVLTKSITHVGMFIVWRTNFDLLSEEFYFLPPSTRCIQRACSHVFSTLILIFWVCIRISLAAGCLLRKRFLCLWTFYQGVVSKIT